MPSKSILVFFTANHHFQTEREIFHQFFLFISFLWNQKQTLADSLGSRLKAKRSKSFTPSVTSQVISLMSLLFYITWKKNCQFGCFAAFFKKIELSSETESIIFCHSQTCRKKISTTFFSKKFQKRFFFLPIGKILRLDHNGRLWSSWQIECWLIGKQILLLRFFIESGHLVKVRFN